MRADALANRERLLDAASDVFAEHGIHVPIHAVAQRAGVGVGTLYRHFADRDAVIIGLVERLRARLDEISAVATAASTGWEGITVYIDGVTAMHLDYPWMTAVRDRARQIAPSDASRDAAAFAAVARAKAEGSLRTDVDAIDLAFIPTLLAGLVSLDEPLRSAVMARERALLLDALRPAGAARPALGAEPVAIDELARHLGRPAGSIVAPEPAGGSAGDPPE